MKLKSIITSVTIASIATLGISAPARAGNDGQKIFGLLVAATAIAVLADKQSKAKTPPRHAQKQKHHARKDYYKAKQQQLRRQQERERRRLQAQRRHKQKHHNHTHNYNTPRHAH